MTDSNPNPEPQADPTPQADPAPQPTGREKFIGELPEEFRADPIFANFDDWNGVAKSYANAAKLVGMDKNQILALPKESTPETMAPIWDKLGRPADSKGYDLEQYKEVIPPEVSGKYADIAYKNGVPKGALNEIIKEFVNDSVTGQKAIEEQQEMQVGQWKQDVKKEFGAAYEEKLDFGRKVAESSGVAQAFREDPLLSPHTWILEHPALVKAFVNFGEKTSEGMVLANGSVTHGKLSPNEAKMELAKFTSDENNIKAMTDKSHPQHEFIMKKRSDLFKFAYPE